jgi:hypothetical protein
VATRGCAPCHRDPSLIRRLNGWRNTAEIVLFEISNSLKPYPSAFLAYIGKSRPVIGFSEPNKFIEVSNRIPPTSHRQMHARSQPSRRQWRSPELGVHAAPVSSSEWSGKGMPLIIAII